MFQRMPGSASIRTLAVVGNGVTAALLEGAGINVLADAWAVDLDDVNIIPRLIASAERLSAVNQECQWNNILTRAYNRLILLQDAERFDIDVPLEYRCSISFQWPNHVVRTPDGRIYDRVWIERWVQSAGTNPFTREPLSLADLQEDHPLQHEIDHARFLNAQGNIPVRM